MVEEGSASTHIVQLTTVSSPNVQQQQHAEISLLLQTTGEFAFIAPNGSNERRSPGLARWASVSSGRLAASLLSKILLLWSTKKKKKASCAQQTSRATLLPPTPKRGQVNPGYNNSADTMSVNEPRRYSVCFNRIRLLGCDFYGKISTWHQKWVSILGELFQTEPWLPLANGPTSLTQNNAPSKSRKTDPKKKNHFHSYPSF